MPTIVFVSLTGSWQRRWKRPIDWTAFAIFAGLTEFSRKLIAERIRARATTKPMT